VQIKEQNTFPYAIYLAVLALFFWRQSMTFN
jgi:hypothetical protein